MAQYPLPRPDYQWTKQTGQPQQVFWQWAFWIDSAVTLANAAIVAINTAIATINTTLTTIAAQITALQALVDANAWSAYTPTITAGAGTFTTVSATGRSKTIGKTQFIEIIITITTVGTAAGAVIATLPANAQADAVMAGRVNSTAKAMIGKVAAAANTLSSTLYDGTTAIAAGAVIVISGAYETA